MNDYDKNNLNFILNLPDKEIPIWFNTISEDDRNYALELLRDYRTELILHALEMEDEVEDVSQAKEYLKSLL